MSNPGVYRGAYGMKYHKNGIAEIRAAVINQAYQDYVEACKFIFVMESDIDGFNVDQYRTQRLRAIRKLVAGTREYEMRVETKLSNARWTVMSCERFFRSEHFALFADSVSGEKLIEQAHHIIQEWAEDKVETTAVRISIGSQAPSVKEWEKRRRRYAAEKLRREKKKAAGD